jgi:hypothetical protein
MAKKKPTAKAKKRSQLALPVSYETTYALVLRNGQPGDGGCTLGILLGLVNDAIDIIDACPDHIYGKEQQGRLKGLLVIKEQLEVEFFKYDEGRA